MNNLTKVLCGLWSILAIAVFVLAWTMFLPWWAFAINLAFGILNASVILSFGIMAFESRRNKRMLNNLIKKESEEQSHVQLQTTSKQSDSETRDKE